MRIQPRVRGETWFTGTGRGCYGIIIWHSEKDGQTCLFIFRVCVKRDLIVLSSRTHLVR